MAYTFDGVNDAISIPDIASVGDFSLYCLVNPIVVATGVAAFAWDNYPTAPRQGLIFKPDHNATSLLFEAYVDDTGGLKETTKLAAGTWYKVVVTRNGATMKFFVDGSQVGTDLTVGAGTFTAGNIRLGCHFFSGANNEFSNTAIAEYAIWSSDIGAAGIATLGKGASPRLVRPESIIRYIPLLRAAVELRTGATVTQVDVPTVSVHPSVINPIRPQIVSVPAAALSSSGGSLTLLGIGN